MSPVGHVVRMAGGNVHPTTRVVALCAVSGQAESHIWPSDNNAPGLTIGLPW
jgi:hypothetical protein